MTSISSLSTASYSPLDLLKSELSKEVSSGQISSSDQTALSSALDTIDSALKNGGATSISSQTPDQLQSKIDSLIQSEVSSGKLTSSQASELKNVFSNALGGGPGGAGGPPPSQSSDNDSDDSSTSSTSSSSSSSNSSTVDELIKKFVEALKAVDRSSPSSSYGSNGSTTSSKSQTSLLVDYRS